MPKILIVEDTDEQQEIARSVVEAAGHQAIVTDQLIVAVKQLAEGVDGVITDLFFNPFGYTRWAQSDAYRQRPPACGLEVVIAAMHLSVPVVICTNAGKHNSGHHGEAMSWVYDAFYAHSEELEEAKRLQLGAPQPEYGAETVDYKPFFPFGWDDWKDWENALKILESRMSR